MTETTTQPTAMDQVSSEFWEAYLRQNPTSATIYGDDRYDDLLPDPSAAGRAEGIAAIRRANEAARAIPADTLTTEDRVKRGLRMSILREALFGNDRYTACRWPTVLHSNQR